MIIQGTAYLPISDDHSSTWLFRQVHFQPKGCQININLFCIFSNLRGVRLILIYSEFIFTIKSLQQKV